MSDAREPAERSESCENPASGRRSGRGTLVSEDLAALASAYGVDTEYQNWREETVAVRPETVVAVLGALGVDATTPDSIRHALDEARLAPWRRLLPPVVVTRAGMAANVPLRGPEGEPTEAWIELENGGLRRDLRRLAVYLSPVDVDGIPVEETPLQTPEDLPLGWHRVRARCAGWEASAVLVVTPPYLGLPPGMPHPEWGPMVQLYSVRSRHSWGAGELPDLAELASGCAREHGAGLVLVNPLHAAEPVTPIEPSPYFPESRRFAGPMYLRVEDIPEFADLPAPDRQRVADLAAPLRRANHTADLLDRDAVWEAKRAALELVFGVPRTGEREAAFADFRAGQGDALRDFATWCALVERHGLPWQQWPPELHDPRSYATARAREELAERVEFYCWLQWVLDEQLASAQSAAEDAGMALGVVHDLAVGAAPGGADAWMLGPTLAHGATAGAPPDAFNQQGQDWGLPPWRPDQLAAEAYAPYRDMLRFTLRHAGGLRMDHVLGLFRLWWVPEGMPASAGTYVHYDHEALVGILALEAGRAGAVVVGEDLGTVEPWVRRYLRERGVLGTSMLWFETDEEGRPRPPEKWRELCLATVGTHDMPPVAGYLGGDHIELRSRLGLLERPAEEERADDEAGRLAWLERLRELGLLADHVDPAGAVAAGTQPEVRWEVVRGLHAFLARTPARLRGVALTDAVGDRRIQNQPGTTERPNWRVPLSDGSGRPVLLEDLFGDGPAARGLRDLARAVRGKTEP